MPWKERSAVDEREMFVREWMSGRWSFSALCDQAGVSRKTGYKWIQRFEQEGLPGLVDRTSAPRKQARQTSQDVSEAIVALRERFPFWGPKKLKVYLESNRPEVAWPAASTIGDIISRAGLVRARRKRRRVAPMDSPLAACNRANDVWCADYKGKFRVGGRYCHPLTITDGFSRYLLRCEGMVAEKTEPAWKAFEATFQEYGLPLRIRTDNGAPFATQSAGGLSRLSVKWIKLGIVPERIQPGKPQQNGRHERMHRTLKAQTAKPPRDTFPGQQAAFDRFRHHYNTERPHEALGQEPPVSAYVRSPRTMPNSLHDPEYPEGLHIARASPREVLRRNNHDFVLGRPLAGEAVGLELVNDGEWTVWFGPVYLGTIQQIEDKEFKFIKSLSR